MVVSFVFSTNKKPFVICTRVTSFALVLQKSCTPFSANQNWVIFSCILLAVLSPVITILLKYVSTSYSTISWDFIEAFITFITIAPSLHLYYKFVAVNDNFKGQIRCIMGDVQMANSHLKQGDERPWWLCLRMCALQQKI